jgi:membrane-associated phospholipid phosphatase
VKFLRAVSLIASAVILCSTNIAQAMETISSESYFQLHPLADLATLSLSSSAIVLPMTLDHAKYWEEPLGSPDDINWLDHFALNRWSPNIARFADLMAGGSIVLPLSFALFDTLHNHHTKDYFLDEAGVFTESVLVTIGVTEIAKHLLPRPRPYVYGQQAPEEDREKTDAYLSFWSAHAAVTACALTSFAYIQMKDNPGKATTKLAVVGALTVIPTVGVLMVLSGHHFPSDVLVGAGVGTALGLLIPYLHLRHDGGVVYGSVSPLLPNAYDGFGFTINLVF